MANNRLYLYDPDTKEKFMLAKCFGEKWEVWHEDDFSKRFQEWIEKIEDDQAIYGASGSTKLKVLSEGDLPENL